MAEWNDFKRFFPLRAADVEAEWLADERRTKEQDLRESRDTLIEHAARDDELDADDAAEQDELGRRLAGDEDMHILTPEARRVIASM